VRKRLHLDLDGYLPYLIHRVGSALAGRFTEDTLARHDLSIAMWRVLAALSANGEQRQIDLAAMTSIDVSTLSRLVTRLVAIVPAIIVTALYGSSGVASLLVFSQVVLSLQLPFAIVPLVRFTTDRAKMGAFKASRGIAALAWFAAAVIIALNVKLLFDVFVGN